MTFVVAKAPVLRLLRSELRWIFRRPRTLILLGLLALYPILPLGTTIAAADALAGESANGTMRGLLLAPVSRTRLLAVKAFGVAVVSLTATVMTALIAFITGLIIAGTGTLVTISGTTLPVGEALTRVLIATMWVVVQMWAIGAIALAVSAATEHPLIVMASVIGGLFVFGLLSNIPVLDWLQPFLITDSWESIVDVLREPMPWDGLLTGFLRAVCYIVIGYSLALAKMVTKDG
jgi:ABC-2 type transport system permease protein